MSTIPARTRHPHSALLGCLGRGIAALVALAVPAAADTGTPTVEYNRDVRPILSDNCFACHGPDSASRKADLRLDQRDAAVELEAIVPGKPDESEAIRRIFSTEPDEVMPPRKTKKTLTDAQKDILKRWVAEGAKYQPHWSFIAPKRPPLPEVKNTSWARNPIDRFVLAKLEEQGLTPAPEADRRTLARRLSLDLTGLPPDPALVESFVNDPSPDAYEKLVDRLLASEHWGEHRGRFWLDAARYADTHGIHFDNYREMWTYRDEVIAAFNRNQPFDQFTIEQLAGDLLPNPTLEQRVASGFNRCNITTNEGGAIPEEYLVLYDRDRTETTSQVWLGLTTGCAVCHDHKFDPISQTEFYSLAAYFNNTTQGAMDGNIKDTPPTVFVPAPRDRDRWDALRRELAEAKQQSDARRASARAEFDLWLAGLDPKALAQAVPTEGLQFHAPLSEGTGSTVAWTLEGAPRTLDLSADVAWKPGHVAAESLQIKPGNAPAFAEPGDYEKDQGFSYGAWVQVPKAGQTGAVLARMDDQNGYRGWDLYLDGNRVATHIVHKWQEDALKVVAKGPLKPGSWNHVFVVYDGSRKASGVRIYVNGKRQPTDVAADHLASSIRTNVPLKIGQRHTQQGLKDLAIQDVRIYGRTLAAADVERIAGSTRTLWLATRPVDQRSAAEKDELFNFWLTTLDPTARALAERTAALTEEEAALKTRGTVAHVMQEKGEAPMAFVLFRGEYDKRRNPVKPSVPAVLPPMPPDYPQNRLGLAKWLLRPDHPLTARVTVNRFWQEVFGTGIVRTAGDFGVTGELPSHPELLDWLAVEFRESGWDVKQFFKLLVTSAAYRQSARATTEKVEKDPMNRLLSRGPRFRMDAEMIRDYALEASGLLVEKLGGPSVKPYQPEGVWEAVAMIGSNTRDYKRDAGDKLYRRSLYTFWKRSAPPASMDIFNAPSREVCTVRRERTDTPLQALVTLNDPQFVEAARRLAENALKTAGPETDGRIDFLAHRLLARPFRPEEQSVVRASLDELLGFYRSHPDDAKQLITVGESRPDPALDGPTLAAWTMLSNELFNLDEVLNK